MSIEVDLTQHPALVFDKHTEHACRSGDVTRKMLKELRKRELAIMTSHSIADTIDILAYSPQISTLIFDWDSFCSDSRCDSIVDFLEVVQNFNDVMPIFIITQEHEIPDADYMALKDVVGFFWKYADTADFIAGRIKIACQEYIESLYPPFFKELYHYSKEYKYAWHTPGHMGGVAFLKSPIGRLFYDFYGENTFRSDLSVSVPELGSLMEHSEVTGAAENFAAQTFGADFTYFVTNGTSTSNKIVVMGSVTKNDIVIVDRNCHKSLQHALTLADVVPIYFKPSRNAYGIIGGIPLDEFRADTMKQKIQQCPLVSDKNSMPKLAVVTNSTYDGLVYNVDQIKDALAKSNVPALHFDEAWFPYAHFHPLYKGKYAMSAYHKNYHPTVFSTQSTHKLLAAFSQASMVHVKQGNLPIKKDLLNETFMMHTSTSPQYSIIASLDVSSKMMSGNFGRRLVSESMTEAIAFRQEFNKIKQQYASKNTSNQWFFTIWQPEAINSIPLLTGKHFIHLPKMDDKLWALKSSDFWHGFSQVDDNHLFLDPIKVTLLTPGIDKKGGFEKFGIPAPIISKYLMNKGVVDEKTGFYSLLFLFSIGVNKSKAMTLLSDLVHFKDCFDNRLLLADIFPDLVAKFCQRYQKKTLVDLATEMHTFLRDNNASRVLMDAFDVLPEQVMTPNEAYQHIVRANTKEMALKDLKGKTILTMVAPYPPGIPVVMPGERLHEETQIIIDYLQLLESFDNHFPGFENEVHGAEVKIINGKRRYMINCLA